MTNVQKYNADLGQFVSDYYAMGPQVRKDSDRTIAEQYIESCLEVDMTPEQIEDEVNSLIPQINYLRA